MSTSRIEPVLEWSIGRKASNEHMLALVWPDAAEQGVVFLTRAIYSTVSWHLGEYRYIDYITGPAVGSMLEAARTLLGMTTTNLNPGIIDGWLIDVAETIGYDMDKSEWIGAAS